MKILPILFNTEMVRALRDGRKSVTRRVIKPQPPATAHVAKTRYSWGWSWWEDGDSHEMKPPFHPGDILYVRETWAVHPCRESDWLTPDLREKCRKTGEDEGCCIFAADGLNGITPCGTSIAYHKWRPSIHMPKEAARIFLRVTDVRVERLQDITEEQARAEGVGDPYDYQTPEWYEDREELAYSSVIAAFAGVWDSTIKPADLDKYGWGANPWVWVISFERVDRPEGWTDDRPGI